MVRARPGLGMTDLRGAGGEDEDADKCLIRVLSLFSSA
jgi:hypothetical protein